MLEYEEETGEFSVLAMHNFEHQIELEGTGKRFPAKGRLRSVNSDRLSLYGYLSDDHVWVSIQLRSTPKLE